MSQTSYPSVSQPARGKGKAQAGGDAEAAASAGKPSKSTSTPTAGPSKSSISSEEIAKRAYEKYVARGGAHGSDQEDWAAAERELTAETRGR